MKFSIPHKIDSRGPFKNSLKEATIFEDIPSESDFDLLFNLGDKWVYLDLSQYLIFKIGIQKSDKFPEKDYIFYLNSEKDFENGNCSIYIDKFINYSDIVFEIKERVGKEFQVLKMETTRLERILK